MEVRGSASRPVKPLSSTPLSPPGTAQPRANVRRPQDAFEATSPPRVRAAQSTPFTLPTQGVWSTDTQTGNRSDPVTLYVHGNLSDLEATLAQAGWTKADPQGWSASFHYIGAALKQEALSAIHWAGEHLSGLEVGLAGVFGVHLPTPEPTPPPHVDGVDRMPVSAQTVGGKPFVSAWEANNNPLGGRDHVRIWDTGQRDAQGLPVFAVSPVRDSGIRFAPDHPESGFLFHTVESNVGLERDKLLALLRANGTVRDLHEVSLAFGGPSYIGEKVDDSKVYELTLGVPPPASGQGPSAQPVIASL